MLAVVLWLQMLLFLFDKTEEEIITATVAKMKLAVDVICVCGYHRSWSSV